jgi:3-hydroxyacyl-CoA dehydrogenase
VPAEIREFAKEDPVFWQPSPLIVDLVERGATLPSLNHTA